MKEGVRLGRPSIVATLLWAFGIVIIALTVYSMISWSGGWTEDLHDVLLVFVSFSTGINAIATGALIEALLRSFFEAESEGTPRKVVELATMKRSFREMSFIGKTREAFSKVRQVRSGFCLLGMRLLAKHATQLPCNIEKE